MKNIALIRRLMFASLIIGFTVPMLYHTVIKYTKLEQYQNLTAQVCKAVEPQVQAGAFRSPIEYAQGMMLRQGFEFTPEVVFVDHGKEITPPHKSKLNQIRVDCEFAGYQGVGMSIYFPSESLLSLRYLYQYLISVPIFFLIFMGLRVLLNRFQQQVVDTVQNHIKSLLQLDTAEAKPNTGNIGRLLELNIPLIGYLKSHIQGMEEQIVSYSTKIAEQKKSEVLADVAAQVAHDIVAPISTIEIILNKSSDSSFNKHPLVFEELARMKALAQKMLRQYRGQAALADTEKFDVTDLLQIVAAEAKILTQNQCDIDLRVGEKRLIVDGVRAELSAALSNIVKNSVDAINKDFGRIEISVAAERAGVTVKIKDNGAGISVQHLESIFEKGVSHGKKDGTGLGLYQAKNTIELMGGTLRLESDLGRGTTAIIHLPLCTSPAPEIYLKADAHLVFLDDEPVIHETWKMLLPKQIPHAQTHFFYTAEELRGWSTANQGAPATYFFDYELTKDGGPTGMDLMIEMGLVDSAFLVTGRAKDPDVMSLARKSAVRVIDKEDMHELKFNVINPQMTDLILIDDSKANRFAWQDQADMANRSIATFACEKKFLDVADQFARSTPIYVDYFFDGKPTGGEVAEHLISKGFSNVVVATSYSREKISVPHGIVIVGKEFPFS